MSMPSGRRRWGRATSTALAATIALAAALLGAAPAGAYVYWVNGSGAGQTIARAQNDGTGVQLGFITGVSGVTSLAVTPSYLFWTSSTTSSVGRANIDGTGVQPSLIAGQPLSYVTADASHLYVTNQPTGSNHGRVSVATFDGTVTTPALVTDPDGLSSYYVAANGQYLYRDRVQSGSVSSIERTGLDGTGPSVTLLPGSAAINGLAVSADHVYALPATTGTAGFPLLVAGLGASDFATLVPGDGRRRPGVAVAGCRLFWTAVASSSPAVPASIGTATSDGGGVDGALVSTGVVTPGPIAADLLPAVPSVCSGTPDPPPPVTTTTTTTTTPTTPITTITDPTVPPPDPHHHYTQAELDEMSLVFLGFVIPNATVDSILDAAQYQLPSFGGGVFDLGIVACVQRCLGGGAGAVVRHEGWGLAAVTRAITLPTNAIATASIPAGSGPGLTEAQLKVKVLAATKLLRTLGIGDAKAKALKAKHGKAAVRQRTTLAKARKRTITALKKLGVKPVHLKVTTAGRKALITVRKQLRAHKKVTIALQAVATDKTDGLRSVTTRTVKLSR